MFKGGWACTTFSPYNELDYVTFGRGILPCIIEANMPANTGVTPPQKKNQNQNGPMVQGLYWSDSM